MITQDLLDSLRFRSEGAGLDFKRTQYHFYASKPEAKAELLKDVLCMANAWRDGTAYILIGFEDKTPHPAEVVGIAANDHIDDAAMQQFINSKVHPKLTFTYTETLYQGKTVGVISIPKQPRPFWSTNDYAAIRANAVYVRRGSSSEVAAPDEVLKMGNEDAGKGAPDIALMLLNQNNEPLLTDFALRFVTYKKLPDFKFTEEDSPFFVAPLMRTPNRNYWRDAAKYLKSRFALIQIKPGLVNRSGFALSHAKLEIGVNPLAGQTYRMMGRDELPEAPQTTNEFAGLAGLGPGRFIREQKFTIDERGVAPVCHVRLGNLLPGETAWAEDILAIIPNAPGSLQVCVRILAAELPTPLVREHAIETTGHVEEWTGDNVEAELGKLKRRRQEAK